MKEDGKDRQEFEKLRVDNPGAIPFWEKTKRDLWLKEWGEKHERKTDKTREMIRGTTNTPNTP
jgi:hypothetical protein